MTPLLVYTAGQSFGERAMLDNKKRAGTIITMTDCHFAIVGREAYDRLLKKDQEMKIYEKILFMKQVAYMRTWKMKEIQDLEPFCKEVHYELRGHVVAQEGTPSDNVIIVLQGELEVVKRDLTSCYFNEKTGVLGV